MCPYRRHNLSSCLPAFRGRLEPTSTTKCSTGALWAIDHGTCLFLERISAGKRTTSFELPRNHFLAGPPRSADPIDLPLEGMEERVNDVLKTAPEEWFAAFPFNADELARRLVLYMRDFSSRFNPNQADGS